MADFGSSFNDAFRNTAQYAAQYNQQQQQHHIEVNQIIDKALGEVSNTAQAMAAQGIDPQKIYTSQPVQALVTAAQGLGQKIGIDPSIIANRAQIITMRPPEADKKTPVQVDPDKQLVTVGQRTGEVTPVAGMGPRDVSNLVGPELRDALAKKAGITSDNLDVAARALNDGNISVLQNLGRGKQGGEAVKATRDWAAHILTREEGLTPAEAADKMNMSVAKFKAMSAGAQSLGKREAAVVGAATTALAVAPRVIETSREVSRTDYPLLNNIILAAKQGTGDPNVVRFGIALNTLVNTYARAQGAGSNAITDTARKEAHDILQKAWSDGQLDAAIDQIVNKELPSEITGAKQGMREFLTGTKPKAQAAPAPAAPAATGGWSVQKVP